MSSPSITDRPKRPISDSGSGAVAARPSPNSLDQTSTEATTGNGDGLRRAAQLAVIGAFVILFGAFLQAGRVVLLPIASAIVIGVMLSPLARRAESYRVPPAVFAVFAVIFFIVLIQFALVAVAAPLVAVLSNTSDIGDNIRQKLEFFDPLLDSLRTLQSMIAPGAAENSTSANSFRLDPTSVAQPVISFLTPAAGEVVIFLATLFFYLISRDALRRSLILMGSGSEKRLRAIRIFNEVEEKLVQYIGTVALINVVLGVLTALGTYLLGYPHPALLGALEFVCAFVPYIGAAFMTVVLFGVGVISFSTWQPTLLAVALFMAMVTCEGQFITPRIVGARFTTNPLIVFVVLAFWTWLWGPVGTFLSVPFLLIGAAVFNHFFAEDEPALPR
jgi:predicted PurR-regulated permease PerM